jgi:hypothetical protein
MPRGRKKAVSTAKMFEWLHLVEVENKSALEISKTDPGKFDARTVRKYLEIARQEREMNEARGKVLRDTLERHFAAIIAFVQKLDQAIASSQPLTSEKGDYFWLALHQHLPRSPIFKLIDRWEKLRKDISDISTSVRTKLDDSATSNKLYFRNSERSEGLDPQGLFSLIYQCLELLSSDQDADALISDVKITPAGRGTENVIIGNWPCAIVPIGQHDKVVKFVKDLFTQIKTWPEIEEMRKAQNELTSVTRDLREGFAKIMLRGILPGRCEYCPF